MVEVLVGLIIIGGALVVMAATMYSAFGSIAFSKQRNTATALANKAMEQIRALPFTQLNMDSGVGDATFATDTAITTMSCPTGVGTGTCYGFKGTAAYPHALRLIPTVAFPSGQHGVAPLDPHQNPTTLPGGSIYNTSTYITYDANNDADNRVATVIVDWTKPGQGGQTTSVQVESTIFASNFVGNPANNVSVSTATVTPGIISVKGTVIGAPAIDIAMNLDSAFAQVGGSVGAGGATASAGTAESKASVLGTTFADTPSSSVSATSAAGTGVSPPSPPATTGTISSTPWSLVTTPISGILALASVGLTPSVWTTTTADATAASSAQNTNNVHGAPSATIPNSSLPYAAASASTTGAASVNLDLPLLLNVPVLTVVPTGNATPDVATVDQEASPTKKITATASKSFGTINVLTLPGLLGGGTSIVSLSGWQATAKAVGVPGGQTAIASTTSSVGTLRVLGASVIDLSTVAGTVPLVPTINNLTGLGLLGATGTITVTGNVTVGSRGSTTATNGQATVNSPLNVQLHIAVVVLGTSVVSLDVNIDLGSVTATAVYPS